MGTTTSGLPYPEPTDAVAAGADAIKALAQQVDLRPVGRFGSAVITASQTGIGATDTDVTGLTVSFLANPGRRYKITAMFEVQQQTASANITIRITDPANVSKQVVHPVAAASVGVPINMMYLEQGITGMQTRKVRATTNAGTLTILAGSTSPGTLLVEDIGAV